MIRRVVAVVVLAAAAAVGYAAYSGLGPFGGEEATGRLTLYGNVDIRQVDIAFNVEGRIATMKVEEGDAVKKGEVLASLDNRRFDDAVRAAEATVRAHRAALDRLVAGSRPQEIAKAEADVRAAEATWRDAKATLERQQTLIQRNVASQQALDAAQAAERSARARLDALREQLALIRAGPREEDIAEARAQLAAAEADLSLAAHRLDDTMLRAPDDGIVFTRIQEPGAVIQANTPIYTLSLTGRLWVRAYVGETSLGQVQPGMEAAIRSDSSPNHVYHGWVGFISPTAEFTPKSVETPEIRSSLVYRLRVYIRDADERLRQGMPVTVTLAEGGPS